VAYNNVDAGHADARPVQRGLRPAAFRPALPKRRDAAMTKAGTVRRMFPGGNTWRGFHSFYDQIIGPDARRVFILKGGPGAGKSTFMKWIADRLAAMGFDAEYHHCSADPASVDAVVFPSLRTALLDGTAPHVVDPPFPG
jgi:Adenylate kinase and related kinases